MRVSKRLIIYGIFLFFTFSAQGILGQTLSISIDRPEKDANVSQRSMVSGKVSDVTLMVYIAIRPMATSEFWIQEIPNISKDGTWAQYCYFGEPAVGRGEPYEIIAFASRNRTLLKPGQKIQSPLPDNPGILVKSDIVRVIRNK